MYNYYEAMKNDVAEAIKTNYDVTEWIDNRDGFEETLNDALWTYDSVTGNGSGSYTFNRAAAQENLIGNEDLIRDMIGDFCIDSETIADRFLSGDYEWFDVSIRCYLLPQVIAEVLDDMEESGAFTEKEEAAA